MKITHYKWRLVLLACLIALIAILRWSNLGSQFNITFFQHYNSQVSDLISNHYVAATIGYCLIIAFMIMLFVPLTPIMNIAGGFFFGFVLGSLYALFGAIVGSIVAFLIFRYLLKNVIMITHAKKLETFNHEIKKHGSKYLLSLQLLPVTPYGVIIILASLSGISLFTFIWTTSLGILPSTLLYVYAGRQLMEVKSIEDLLSGPLLTAFILLALLSLLPLFIRLIERMRKRKS